MEGSGSAGKVGKMMMPHEVGLLRGALARMGVAATVVAESGLGNSATTIQEQNTVTFHVRTTGSASTASVGPGPAQAQPGR